MLSINVQNALNFNLLYLVHWHWQEIRNFVYRKEKNWPKRIAETKVASICWLRSRWQRLPRSIYICYFRLQKGLLLTKSLVIRANFGKKIRNRVLICLRNLSNGGFQQDFEYFFAVRVFQIMNEPLGRWPPISCQIQLDVRLKKHQELIQATKLSGWQPDSSKKINFLCEFTMPVNSPKMSNELACL